MVLADWLEENGEAERARFIRYQCDREWHRLNDSDGRHEVEYPPEADCWPCIAWPDSMHSLCGLTPDERRGIAWTWERGFVAEVRCTLADWIGAECHECRGQRVVAGVVRAGATGGALRICPTCDGIGRTPGIGPAVVAAHPVERVVLTDRQPSERRPGKWGYYVVATRPNVLVNAYWLPTAFKGSGVDGKLFDAPDLATAALSVVALAWAKSQPIPVTRPATSSTTPP